LATVEVVLRKPRSAEEYRTTLVDARNIGKQMRELVERLLALARIDAGVAKLQTGTVDVADLVEQCTTLLKPLAVANELTLSANCPAHLLWFTDGDKLREVLINLLNNAVQYNTPGGNVSVNVSVNGEHLEVAVSDTGIGIAAEAIPHVFERFYRVDPSREASELNAGLGLSIVHGYVVLLGGKIDVSSTVGKGTTFRISLPDLNTDRSREAA
jgi:signal transduction histidine kinase